MIHIRYIIVVIFKFDYDNFCLTFRASQLWHSATPVVWTWMQAADSGPQEEPDSNETLKTLQNYVTHLTDLVDQVNSLRNQAHSLLAPSAFARTEAEQGFEQINSLRTIISEPVTQDSFKKAYDSFSKNPENVGISEARRLRLKRTCVFFRT